MQAVVIDILHGVYPLMIFPAMMFMLGFVCASLLAWLIMPVFVRSIARNKTTRHHKMPKDVKQALADKDRLRAEFALSLRKRERTIEKLKSRAHGQLVEIAEGNATIGTMKKEMDKINDLADRRYRDKEKLRHSLKPAMVAKEATNEAFGQVVQVKESEESLTPRDIKLSEISRTVKSSEKIPAGKGSLANRIRKLKNTD